MKKFVFGILIGMILTGVSFAADQPKHNATYNNHSLCFEVPQNWSVIKDIQAGNVTQIVLSDGANAIRIDLINHSNINEIIGEYLDYHVSKSESSSFQYDFKNLTGDEWRTAYERFPWYSNDAISEYYQENIVRPVTQLGGTGSGISVRPDGVEYAGIATNNGQFNSKGIDEWFIAWTKPKYDSEIIGVHSLFRGDYPSVKIEWGGSQMDYAMPEPLWTILTTINRGNKPLPKTSDLSSLIDLV